MSNSSAWTVDQKALVQVKEPPTRVVNMHQLGRALTEYDAPPLLMLFVYNCNPAVTMPDQNRVLRGRGRDDLFTVVFDQVLTDTARWADVVLPVTTFLEHYDVAKAYGPVSLQLVQPMIEPVGESRCNVEVFSDLGRRLGVEVNTSLHTDPETLMHVTQALSDGVRESLLENGSATSECPVQPIQFVDVFPRTLDARIDLFPDSLETQAPTGIYTYRGETAADTYPLVLLSPATSKSITSTLGELRTRQASLEMPPSDAGARHLVTDDPVRVFNDLGEVRCLVRLNPDMKPGTVDPPKGLWRKSTMNGSTANALMSDELTDIGGGACFNDARVEVIRVVTAELGERTLSLWAAGDQADELH